MSGADTAPSMIHVYVFLQAFNLVGIQEIILEQFLKIKFIYDMIYIYERLFPEPSHVFYGFSIV